MNFHIFSCTLPYFVIFIGTAVVSYRVFVEWIDII